jgi:hypothetical protein
LPTPPKPPPTTSTITSSSNPSFVGQDVTFFAKIDQAAFSGTVSFVDGLIALGTATLREGEATFKTNRLTAGAHTITAVYGGDANHAGSTSPELIQTVEKQATSTTISSTANPAAESQPVTFKALVAVTPIEGATPTGIVSFYADGVALGTSTLDASSSATFSTPSLQPGTYKITAVYGGSPAFTKSTSSVITQVMQ